MKNFYKLLLLAISTTSFAQNGEPQQIVGGTDVAPEEYPWMVEILNNTNHHCGGVLIHEDWVLTAAHCIKEFPALSIPVPNNVIINTTVRETAQSYSEERTIEAVYPYPTHSFSNVNALDIGLIKLESGSSITPVDIHTSDPNLYEVNDTAYTMGWGITETMAPDLPTNLQIAKPLIKDISSSLIKAGFSTGEDEAGAAAGDSGGPLFVNIGGNITIIGLVSGGDSDVTAENLPGKFTKIYAFKNWIDSTVNGLFPVSTDELLNPEFSIYQNDKHEVFVLNKSDKSSGVTISNNLGQLVEEHIISASPYYQQININNLSSGVYFLHKNSGEYIGKIIR
jgi:secreted trypsin-like serine protease